MGLKRGENRNTQMKDGDEQRNEKKKKRRTVPPVENEQSDKDHKSMREQDAMQISNTNKQTNKPQWADPLQLAEKNLPRL
jgi:hypothetical protein